MNHYNAAFSLKSERIRRRKERLNPKLWILPWLEDACDRKKNVTYKKMKTFVEKHTSIAKAKL